MYVCVRVCVWVLGWSEEDTCPNPGQVGVFEFRVVMGEERGLWGGHSFRVKKRGRGMNAKTAADNNSSLGAGSEKQTQHQATGSVSLATKGRAVAF